MIKFVSEKRTAAEFLQKMLAEIKKKLKGIIMPGINFLPNLYSQ
jgi:hypothetical protein